MPAAENLQKQHLPRLGVIYETCPFSSMDIAEAARDLCRIVWIIGWSRLPLQIPRRFLSRLGDVVEVCSADEDELVREARNAQLDGVIVFTDAAQRLAASIGESLDLAFHSPYAARALSDKWEQRAALKAAGLPVPGFTAIRPSELPTASKESRTFGIQLPAVLKPRQGAGSRDTFFIQDDNQLKDTLSLCADEAFILEEYLTDRSGGRSDQSAGMVSVESVVQHGEVSHLAITGRFPLAPPFRETGSFLPSAVEGEEAEQVLALAAAGAHAVGVDRGVLHTEIKLTSVGPRIIEINGRVGGSVPEMLARLGRPSLLNWAMRLALGLDVGPVIPLPPSPVAFCWWAVAPAGARALRAVTGLGDIRDLPGVAEAHLNRRPGDRLDAREGGAVGHVVAVDGTVPDHASLWPLRHQIESALSLTFT